MPEAGPIDQLLLIFSQEVDSMTKSVAQNSSLFEADDGNRFHSSEVSDPGFCIVFRGAELS